LEKSVLPRRGGEGGGVGEGISDGLLEARLSHRKRERKLEKVKKQGGSAFGKESFAEEVERLLSKKTSLQGPGTRKNAVKERKYSIVSN